jgi:hypothetical protein
MYQLASQFTRRIMLAGVSIAFAIVTPVFAQISGSGSIQGVVSDPSGAVIPNAAVVATNTATGVQTSRVTTGAGFYTISPLPAGEYSIAVAAPGFQKLVQQHVVVDALGVVGLNLKLQLGAAAQEVTVDAAPPPVNTADASMGETVRNEVYTALPLAMSGNAPRNPAAFTQYMPGVTSQTGNTAGNVYGAQPNSQDT